VRLHRCNQQERLVMRLDGEVRDANGELLRDAADSDSVAIRLERKAEAQMRMLPPELFSRNFEHRTWKMRSKSDAKET
jgi:hypothetical protein